MKTLKEIFEEGGAASVPYNTALKVQICGVGDVVNYKNSSGEQRQSLTMGLADHTMAAKAILYDVTKANMLKVGTTLMPLNVIIKRDSKSVVKTNRSKLLKTSPFLESLPPHLIKEGLELACPPPAEVVSINKIKTSPVKTRVSIRGQVVSEEMTRTVKVGGEDTSVRSLKIKDNTGSCKISLWRDLGQMKTPVGGHVEITNVIVQVYNEEKSVSTTSRTKLMQIAAPDIVKSITFIAFEAEKNGCLSLMGDLDDGDYPEFIIKLDLFARALKCKPNEVEARLMVKVPLKADIKAKEKEINQIQIEQKS